MPPTLYLWIERKQEESILYPGRNGMKGEYIVKSKKKGMSLIAKQKAAGWAFLTPATILIAFMSFYPMVRAFIISL